MEIYHFVSDEVLLNDRQGGDTIRDARCLLRKLNTSQLGRLADRDPGARYIVFSGTSIVESGGLVHGDHGGTNKFVGPRDQFDDL